jgi:hypothetical protein
MSMLQRAGVRPRPRGRRPAAAACVLAAGLAGGAMLAAAAPAAAQATSPCGAPAVNGTTATVTCTYTGTAQSWTVPPWVTAASVTLDGAQGGSSPAGNPQGGSTGGKGASVTATIGVTPGDTYTIQVGGAGSSDGSEAGG